MIFKKVLFQKGAISSPSKHAPKTRAKSVPRKPRTCGGSLGGGGDRDSGGEDEWGDWRCSVFVSHIPIAATKGEIANIFGRFGAVDKVGKISILIRITL